MKPVHLRDLTVDAARHPRGQTHLSSASGLVLCESRLYVVADDEHHLAYWDLDGGSDLQLHRLVPGDLPDGKKARKKLKPDLESIAVLPGILFLPGSGSRPNRERGFLVPLPSHGPPGDARAIDLAPWYAPLHDEFADLNIEGAFACGERFLLLQRGNKGEQARNACIEYSLAQVLRWLEGSLPRPPQVLRITPFLLGQEEGAPFGFTDGAALPEGGWIFSAVAEDTENSYEDGACAGSALGWVDAQGHLLRMRPLYGSPKVEGIALDGRGQLLMVTDSDDPGIASRLLSVTLD